MSKLRDASRAVGRGASAEALVLLWNELEPARIAGDEGALAGIESLANAIAASGDEAEQREAGRLLELLDRYRRDEAPVGATARIEGELSPVGAEVNETVEQGEAEESGGRGGGLGGLLWLLLLAAIVLFNLLGDLVGR